MLQPTSTGASTLVTQQRGQVADVVAELGDAPPRPAVA
jgi:hypothetical protein